MSDAWKSVIDADLQSADYKPKAPLADGTYNATITNLVAKTFRSGAKGVEVTYTIQDEGDAKNREVRDYFVIVSKDGQPGQVGSKLLKRLMLTAGLSAQDILKFKFPDFDSKAFGDFKKLLDQPLQIEVEQQIRKSGEHAGKSFPVVAGVKVAA